MEILRRNWWMLSSQGLFLALIGALGLLSAQFVLADLLHYFGIILLAYGFLLFLVGLIKRRQISNWWGLGFFGLLQALVGLVILWKPQQSLSAFTYIIGAFAFLIGLSQLIVGLGKKKRKGLFYLSGLLSILLSLLILFNPWSDDWTSRYLIGFYTLLLGIFLVYYGFQARRLPPSHLELAEENTSPSIERDTEAKDQASE